MNTRMSNKQYLGSELVELVRGLGLLEREETGLDDLAVDVDGPVRLHFLLLDCLQQHDGVLHLQGRGESLVEQQAETSNMSKVGVGLVDHSSYHYYCQSSDCSEIPSLERFGTIPFNERRRFGQSGYQHSTSTSCLFG